MPAEQRHDKAESSPEPSVGDTFDRLDALSRPLAERVLKRAIELHHDDVHGPEQISRRQLDQIAAELGIDKNYIARALTSELATTDDADSSSLKSRTLAPDRITGGRIITMERAELERSIIEWMRSAEGFRPRAKTGSGYRWERNDAVATKLRMSMTGQSASLRSLKHVTHRQTDLGDGRHLVELDADARIVSNTAIGVTAGVGALSIAGGVLSAAGFAGGNDLLQFVAVAAPVATAGVAAGLVTAKAWAGSIRRGIDRALDGISSPELRVNRRTGKRRKSGFAKVLDDIGDAIEDIFD